VYVAASGTTSLGYSWKPKGCWRICMELNVLRRAVRLGIWNWLTFRTGASRVRALTTAGQLRIHVGSVDRQSKARAEDPPLLTGARSLSTSQDLLLP
jgi:hypothetical protein